MQRVGVYVFTDMTKKRVTKKREAFFDGQNYIGLRYIVSQIEKDKYEICYVSKDTVNQVDFVLISLTSYYDMLNIINELHGKDITAKVIIGGAGASNVEILRDIGDIIVLGRGEGIINRLLSGDYVDGVWYKETNYNLKDKIKILPLSEYIEIGDSLLGQYCENSIGCERKCFFCEYSWKNKHQTKTNYYSSGLADRETRFEEINWGTYKNKDLVSAIDGISEQTRKIINKPISNQQIKDKINDIYNYEKDYFSLKLYCLLGYPFELDFEAEELMATIMECKRQMAKNRLNILMVSPHFMPMPFTPMENEPVNKINFRNKIKNYDFKPYQTGNIKVYWNWSLASSPITSLEATIIHRATVHDVPMIKKIICSSKYKSLTGEQKVSIIEKAFSHLIGYYPDVLPYVERTYPTEKAKLKYKKLVDIT